MNQVNKAYLVYLIFLAFSVGFSWAITILIPFPADWVAIIGFWVAFPFIVRSKTFRSFIPSLSKFYGQEQTQKVMYKCLACNTNYNGGRCPKCGSNLKKAEFGI